MPFRATGPTTVDPIDEFPGGHGWMAHPEETMRRASHALAVDGDVWVVDPVDGDGVDDLLADLGTVAGVVVLLDRHQRDADAIARRHDVPVYLPPYVDREFAAETRVLRDELGDTGYRLHRAVSLPGWQEGALYDGETLVVADALGTADYFVAGRERLGVHPALRVVPPRAFREFSPERVLVGHGTGVLSDGAAALNAALDGARRNLPRAWANAAVSTLRSMG